MAAHQQLLAEVDCDLHREGAPRPRARLGAGGALERARPGADAPIDGRIQARVADIGIWSAWVPPGWRLAGELRTAASVGGRLGGPTATGELTGSGVG
ncbi:MAG: hypothetical protein ACK537_12365, partial [Pseudomonadota bacterium]